MFKNDTNYESNIKFLTQPDKISTQLNYDVDVCLSILQAGIDRRVLLNAVDINGRFNLNASSNDILKFQKVDGSTLYDSLEVSFNTVDKTSTLQVNKIYILTLLASKASSFKCIHKTRNNLLLYFFC